MIEVNIKLLCKKTYKSLLALMIMFSMFPQFTETVVAEETTIPVEQFATVEQLKNFNTNDGDGEVKAAKVYFGNNNQQWWIAGSQQTDGLTLFAASPLANDVVFNQDTNEKTYNGQQVYSNHYGASDIKNTLKGLETSFFTSAEQKLMNDTAINTNDSKNNSVYSTTDKLYLAYGDTSVKEYITVGTNDQNNLNNGLRVDKNYYWCGWFWLREPNIKHSQTALGVGSDGSMYGLSVDDNNDLVPAFELNISSVEFASAVSVASSDGQLQIGDAFTLRYNSKDDIGTATISQSRRSLAVTDIKNENTYLVVQNATGAWSKKVNNNDVVFASELNDALTSFENCKVWIETTKDRITYGKLASDGQGRNIKVIPQEGITVVNKTQVGVTNSITDITVKAADGHYLPSNYVDEVKKLALNGLTVSKTEDGIKISGTPTNDVNVVLPEARRDQFVVEGGTKGVDYTYQNGVLTFINNGSYVLKHPPGITDTSDRVVIANNFNGTLTLDNISINLNGVPCIDVASDANLTLIIKGKNKLGVHDGDPAAIQFMNVAENGSLTIDSEEPVGELTLHGRNGPGLGSPGYNSAYTKNIYINGGIIDASSDNGIGIGSYSDSNPSEITINGGIIKGSKIGSNYKGSKVIINGGNIQNSINVETEIDGGFVKGYIEDNEIKNSAGQTVYKAYITLENSDIKSLKVDGSDYNFPAQPGTNDIWLYLPSGTHTVTHENSEGKISEYTIIINEDGTVTHVNAWEKELAITGWTYGQNPNTPTAKSKFGDVVFSYSDKKDGTYTSDVPSNAGTYYVKATVTETENYTGLESVVPFEIKKADSNVTITTKSLDKTYDGNKVNDPTYETSGSDGKVSIKYQEYKADKWVDLSSAPTNVGKYKVVVTLDGNDNFNSASKELEFTISKTTVNTWAEKLSIKGWKYGETANTPTAKAKFGSVTYTYSDKENGTYTSDVPSNAGTYYVKATVTETENYTGLESVVPFEILKADPVLKALDTLTIEEGKTLKSLGLPEGYKWKNPDYECKDLGTYTYKAVYTPKDSVNYNVLDVEVSVKVIAKSVETSPVVTPSITNNNNNTNHTYNGNGTSSTSSSLKELSEVVSKSEYKAYEKAYTKDSYDNYLNAFENAGKVLNNKNSSKEEIKVALDKLNEAILNLKVDKTNLESSLVEFEKLDADNYSEASYIKLKDTLDKAKSVMEDKEASPEEIANAIEELNNAYSSLQSAEPKVETPKKSSVGKVALITTVTTVVVAGGGSYLWILLKRSRGMK